MAAEASIGVEQGGLKLLLCGVLEHARHPYERIRLGVRDYLVKRIEQIDANRKIVVQHAVVQRIRLFPRLRDAQLFVCVT